MIELADILRKLAPCKNHSLGFSVSRGPEVAKQMTPTTVHRSLGAETLALLEAFEARSAQRRLELLSARAQTLDAYRNGAVERLESTQHIRESDWLVDPVPLELLDRRVELVGSPGRQAIIEGMNAGARSYIVDLWNMALTDGQSIRRAHLNIERAVLNRLTYVGADGDRHRINPGSTTRLMVVPRPMNTMDDGEPYGMAPMPASFLDVARLLVRCGKELRLRQGGIYLYLRDVHGHLEARWWNDLFDTAEEVVGLPRGSIRATVVLDNLQAALEADEILFELMHHSAGMSLDPQGFAAQLIEVFSAPDRPVFPDRERIGLNAAFLRNLALLTIDTCHHRKAHAIGAPSYVLYPGQHGKQHLGYLEMIADKEREAVDGHDGTLVADPGLVGTAMTEFNKSMPRAHQMFYERNERPSPAGLIQRPEGPLSTDSLKGAVRTILRALVNRAQGIPVPQQGGRLHDRSSVRLSTVLLWSWVHSSYGMVTDTGLEIHGDLVRFLIRKEGEKMVAPAPESAPLVTAAVERLTRSLLATEVPEDLLEA